MILEVFYGGYRQGALSRVVRTVKLQLELRKWSYKKRRTASTRTSICAVVSSIRNTFHAEDATACSFTLYRFDTNLVADHAFILLEEVGLFEKVFGC